MGWSSPHNAHSCRLGVAEEERGSSRGVLPLQPLGYHSCLQEQETNIPGNRPCSAQPPRCTCVGLGWQQVHKTRSGEWTGHSCAGAHPACQDTGPGDREDGNHSVTKKADDSHTTRAW